MNERVIALTVRADQPHLIQRLQDCLRKEFPNVVFQLEETVQEALQALQDGCHHICNKLDFSPLLSAYRQLERSNSGLTELSQLNARFERMNAQLKTMMQQTQEWLARPVPQKARVDFIVAIRNALEEAGFPAGHAFTPEGNFPIDLDPGQFARLLAEMAHNSYKHHPRPEELKIQVALEGYEHDDRAWVRLDFCDNGNGIASDLKDRIFEPFFHFSINGEWGTGCGLFFVWRVVQAHGGSIHEIGSPPEQGALFRIELPRYQSET